MKVMLKMKVGRSGSFGSHVRGHLKNVSVTLFVQQAEYIRFAAENKYFCHLNVFLNELFA